MDTVLFYDLLCEMNVNHINKLGFDYAKCHEASYERNLWDSAQSGVMKEHSFEK